jgi:apolipoprotein D and lipocalin family protein
MKINLILLACFLLFLQTFGQDMKNEPTTVKYVDIKKYTGTWYEIAKIPNRFQKQCIGNTTATYSLNDDGTIKVVNRCMEEDGGYDDANGLAKVVDKNTNSKLKVSFVNILGIRLFWGDYWIIGLDDNYQWVVIGTPDRKYGWILARSKSPDESVKMKTFEILKSQGYNPKDFQFTPQSK